MGIDICLHGKVRGRGSKKKQGETIRAWLESCDMLHGTDDPFQHDGEDGEIVVGGLAYPACEPVSFRVTDSRVVAEARTNTAGPGYHQHVCELFKAMGKECGVEWLPEAMQPSGGDETRYFHRGDRDALDRSMLDWLQMLCKAMLKDLPMDATGLGLCMPISPTFTSDELAVTPMGPRNRAWFEAVAKDPRNGLDFWAWWDAGFTPRVRANLARLLMWSDLCWRPPASEQEEALHRTIHDSLESAYREDDSLDLPYREWAELIGFGAIEDVSEVLQVEIEHGAKSAKGPLIGYRRRPVIHRVGPASITLPGTFATTVEEEHDAWIAFDDSRVVRLSLGGIDVSPRDAVAMHRYDPGLKPLPGVTTTKECRRAGIGKLLDEDDSDDVDALQGMVAVTGVVALTTMTWPAGTENRWARDAWESLSITANAD